MSEPVVQAHPRGPLTSRTTRIEHGVDLLDLAGESGFVWRSDRHEMVTKGVAARVPITPGPDRIAWAAESTGRLLSAIAHHANGEPPGLGPVAVGALPFDYHARGELVVPELILRRGPDGACWETRITRASADRALLAVAAREPAPWPHATVVRSETGQDAWTRAIETALAAIGAGEIGKVVLARELTVEADRPFDRGAVLRRLRDRADGCFLYAHDDLVGASPELLLRRSGRRADSTPLAGTVPRGTTPAQEAENVAGLLDSAKDAAEHRFVVDAVVDALGRVSERVTARPREVMRLATVCHLATRIEATLRPPAPTALALAGLLHPTPAVGGTPAAAAAALQARLEPFERGRYGGPVGWVDAAGDGEWAVALRGAELDGAHARLVAGVGVVDGSDPAKEWEETEAKFGAMLDILRACAQPDQ